MQSFFCGPRIYEYDGWLFERVSYGGACPLDSDGEPLAHVGASFWDMLVRWDALSPAEQASHRVGGGCVMLNET